MKILGELGIDWKIFLIQILNFLILFFILKRLFFKNFITALKEEKAKTKEIQELKANISQEKANWQKEKEKEILAMKEKINKVLAKAEMFANKIKEENKGKFLEEEKKLLEKINNQSQAITDECKRKMVKDYEEKIFSGIIEIFETEFSKRSKMEIQDGFWISFLKKVEAIEDKEIVQIFQIRKSTPTVLVYSSFPLSKAQKNDLQIVLKRKLPAEELINNTSKNNLQVVAKRKLPPPKLIIKEKIKKELIAGFQLELSGILVEENLKTKIKQIIR